MILPGNADILNNINDKFYYNGIEISKRNFDITEFATVCDKINDVKEQILQEPKIHIVKGPVISSISLKENITLLCKYDKNEIYFGLYEINKKSIIPLTKDVLKKISIKIFDISFYLNKTANLINKGLLENTLIKDKQMLWIFDNYINNIKQLSNSFQHVYELEFINGYKDYILTNDELKQSIIER